MVLHPNRQPFIGRIQAGAFGDGPTFQHAIQFQAEVVMQPARRMFLNGINELPLGSADAATRLWSALELPLGAIGLQRVAHGQPALRRLLVSRCATLRFSASTRSMILAPPDG